MRRLLPFLLAPTFFLAAGPVQAQNLVSTSEQVPSSLFDQAAPRLIQPSFAAEETFFEVPAPKRPALLPLLYVSLGVLQGVDIYSTYAALNAGAREQNPAVAQFVGNPASLIAFKALTTAGTIYAVERVWKKNRVGAIVLIAALNGVTAAVAAHNMRVAQAARAR